MTDSDITLEVATAAVDEIRAALDSLPRESVGDIVSHMGKDSSPTISTLGKDLARLRPAPVIARHLITAVYFSDGCELRDTLGDGEPWSTIAAGLSAIHDALEAEEPTFGSVWHEHAHQANRGAWSSR